MIEVLIGSGASLISALVTWLLARRKASAEIQSIELDNVDKAAAIWRELATDLKLQIAELKEGQQLIIDENNELHNQVSTLERKVQLLTSENKKLRELIEHMNLNTK